MGINDNDEKRLDLEPGLEEVGAPLTESVSPTAVGAAQGSSEFGKSGSVIFPPSKREAAARLAERQEPAPTKRTAPLSRQKAQQSRASDVIGEAPLASLLVAGAVGLALGWVLRESSIRATERDWMAETIAQLRRRRG